MSNANLRLPICASQVACDGVNVRPPRTICGNCERKLEKRAKEAQPHLRGAKTYTTGSEWRKAKRRAQAT